MDSRWRSAITSLGFGAFSTLSGFGVCFFSPFFTCFSECLKRQQITFRKHDSCGSKWQRAVCLLSMYSIFVCWEEFTPRLHIIQQKYCQLLPRDLTKLRLSFHLGNWTFTGPFKVPFWSYFNAGCVLVDRWFWMMTRSCHSLLEGFVRRLGILSLFLLCWVSNTQLWQFCSSFLLQAIVISERLWEVRDFTHTGIRTTLAKILYMTHFKPRWLPFLFSSNVSIGKTLILSH